MDVFYVLCDKTSAKKAIESNLSVEDLQKVMEEIKSPAQTFSADIDTIQTRIETVQMASNENETGVEDIVEKIEQTSLTAEKLNHATQENQGISDAMKQMMDSFS